MIIDFSKRYGCTFYKLMCLAGYEQHPNGKDYIRKDLNGRFHIKYDGDMIWQLHYDIDVEWRHFSMNLPQRCGLERKRIMKLWYPISVEVKSKSIKEKKSPQTYADVLRKQIPQVKKVKGLPTPPNPKKLRPKYADPAVVKAELARIAKERLIHTIPIDSSDTPDTIK